MSTNRALTAATLGLLFNGVALADIVEVKVTGTVVFNLINGAPLDTVASGDAVTVTFRVDSDVWVDGVPNDTRGYEIIQSSFAVEFDTPVSLGLLDPFPAGETPYFTLVDGFPVSDGFFVSTSPSSPGGVPLAQTPFQLNHSLGYDGATLGSLDILDALGTYDFTGLTSFGFNLWSIFPDNVALEIDFQDMTLAKVGPTVYCDSNPNNAADIAIDTVDSASANIVVSLTNGPPSEFVYLLVGDGSGTVSQPPGAKGDLCLIGGTCLGRYSDDIGQIDGSGAFSTDVKNALSSPCNGAVQIAPGTTWNFQFWHRQPMGQPATFSKALAVTFE